MPPSYVSLTQVCLVLLACCTVKVALSLRRGYLKRKMMPPGPPGVPLLGNIFDLPKSGLHEYFVKLRPQYGSVISFNLAGQPMVVITGMKAAKELIDRASFSDRPRFIMTSAVLCQGLFIAFTPYGALWRKLRRATHAGFNVRASESYRPIQQREAYVLVKNLSRDPDKWIQHVNRSAASTILSVVYAWPSLDPSSDPLVERINGFMHRVLMASLPGKFLVEFFPWMLHVPTWMAKWKQWGLEWHQKDTELFEGFLRDTQEKLRSGSAEASFAATLLESVKKEALSFKEAAWLAGTMFGAGAETTAANMEVFLYAMTLNPSVMRRAQAQIDAVVGPHRLPAFADQDDLPYITAIVREVLRWFSVSGLGMHAALQDDWYEGYLIPKGAMVIFNNWGIDQDPDYYPEPKEFRPERFLDAAGQLDIPQVDARGQGHIAFGGGRRICAGLNVANQALFIDVASVLWAFDIEAVEKDDAKVLPSRLNSTDEEILVRPPPFKCAIKLRRPDLKAQIDVLVSSARKDS